MIENQAIDPAVQKQLMKYAEDMARLYQELKKERALLSKPERKKMKCMLKRYQKNISFLSI